MKKLNVIFILLALLALSYGCKKDKDEDENLPASFSIKVGGTPWTGNTFLAVHAVGTDVTQIVAYGVAPSEQVVLTFKGSGTGTFAFNDDNMASCTIAGNVFSTIFDDNPTGEIIITKYDAANGKISGTFSFTGEDFDGNAFIVTEGKFENLALTIT